MLVDPSQGGDQAHISAGAAVRGRGEVTPVDREQPQIAQLADLVVAAGQHLEHGLVVGHAVCGTLPEDLQHRLRGGDDLFDELGAAGVVGVRGQAVELVAHTPEGAFASRRDQRAIETCETHAACQLPDRRVPQLRGRHEAVEHLAQFLAKWGVERVGVAQAPVEQAGHGGELSRTPAPGRGTCDRRPRRGRRRDQGPARRSATAPASASGAATPGCPLDRRPTSAGSGGSAHAGCGPSRPRDRSPARRPGPGELGEIREDAQRVEFSLQERRIVGRESGAQLLQLGDQPASLGGADVVPQQQAADRAEDLPGALPGIARRGCGRDVEHDAQPLRLGARPRRVAPPCAAAAPRHRPGRSRRPGSRPRRRRTAPSPRSPSSCSRAPPRSSRRRRRPRAQRSRTPRAQGRGRARARPRRARPGV